MTIDSPLDPRHSRLVALLYDELPPDEEQALRAELARDPALRAEWDELSATRGCLAAWEIEERTPSFVFMEPPARTNGADADGGLAQSPAGARRGLRLLPGMGPLLTWSGWAVAAAALLFVALAGRGTRFERLDNGFALHFARGGSAPAPALAGLTPGERARLGLSASASAEPDAPSARGGETVALTSGGPTNPAAPGGGPADGSYVTGAELSAQTDQMVNMFARMMNEERSRQAREWTSMLRTVYSDLNDRQFTGYRDLRGRIEAVNVGILLGRSGSGTKPDGTSLTVPADTLKFKTRPRQPNGRNWKYGDFADEPERF